MVKKMLLMVGLILVLVAVLLVVVGVLAYGMSKSIPDKVEAVGPFEVVTHTHRYPTGWNTGELGTATTETYSLRYRSQPFSFEGKAGWFGSEVKRYETFNSIVTFPTTAPALVVNVGDPNNESYYYLIREEGEKAVAQYLGASTGGVSAQWLDPPEGGTGPITNIALHRGRLEGGRWLLLGQYTVLDTRTLEITAFSQPKDFSPNQFKPPVAMAPDGGSFVRFGSIMDMNMNNVPKLAVFEIGAGTTYTLPIDRMRMRYNDWTEIDAAWLDHHWEWKSGEDGRLRLLERKDFEPLPRRGSLKVSPYDGHREYEVSPVKPEMLDRVKAFLVKRHGAELQPPGPFVGTDVFLIGQDKINVMMHDDEVGVWMDRGTDDSIVEELATGFDEVLGTGDLDDLFVPPAGDD